MDAGGTVGTYVSPFLPLKAEATIKKAVSNICLVCLLSAERTRRPAGVIDENASVEDRLNEHQQVVKAERFQVVDLEGNPCVVLGMKNGEPSFELLRADGNAAVSIELHEDQTPSIMVRDQKGRVRIEIRLYDDYGEGDGQYPSVALTGYDGRPRAYMTATPHGYGEIGVTDDNKGTVLLNELD